MQNNIGKVMERGEHLEDLQDKSGEWSLIGNCACYILDFCILLGITRIITALVFHGFFQWTYRWYQTNDNLFVMCVPEHLSSNADAFRVKARSLQRRMWWKECRVFMHVCLNCDVHCTHRNHHEVAHWKSTGDTGCIAKRNGPLLITMPRELETVVEQCEIMRDRAKPCDLVDGTSLQGGNQQRLIMLVCGPPVVQHLWS